VSVPRHASYSQVSSYLTCGKQFQLERVVGVKGKPALYFAGGTTFHLLAEQYDRGELDAWDVDAEVADVWEEVVAKEDTDLPVSEWLKAGRVSKAWPDREDAAVSWWLANLSIQIQAYIKWRAEHPEWTFWRAPGGFGPGSYDEGIELPVSFDVDGIPVVGAIDRVLVINGQLHIMDLKSGSREPEGTLQLAMYATALEAMYGIRPEWGSYYMSRKGDLSSPKFLGNWGTAQVHEAVRQYRRGVAAEVFIPHESNLCNGCRVAQWCTVRGGKDAAGVDPLSGSSHTHLPIVTTSTTKETSNA